MKLSIHPNLWIFHFFEPSSSNNFQFYELTAPCMSWDRWKWDFDSIFHSLPHRTLTSRSVIYFIELQLTFFSAAAVRSQATGFTLPSGSNQRSRWTKFRLNWEVRPRRWVARRCRFPSNFYVFLRPRTRSFFPHSVRIEFPINQATLELRWARWVN